MRPLPLAPLLAIALPSLGCAPPTPDPLPEPRPPVPAAVAAASASAEAPDAAVSPPVAPATRATPLADGETAVVWTRRSRPGPAGPEIVTHFVRADGSVARTRPGIFVADGARLWRWHIEKKTSAGERCAPPQVNPMGARKLERATLVPTRGGAAIEVAPFATARNEYDLPAEEQHEVVASWGAFVFTRSNAVVFPCGMHPGYIASFAAFELDGEGARRALELDVLAGEPAPLLEEAKRRFDEGAQDDTTGSSFDGPVDRDGIKPTMAFPAFRAAGVAWTVQLTADASWAGSFGGWSGYTRSIQLDAPRAPARVAGARLPAAALAFAAAHADLAIGGVGVTTAPLP